MVINKYQGHLFSASQVGFYSQDYYAPVFKTLGILFFVPEHVFIGMCSSLGHAQLVQL